MIGIIIQARMGSRRLPGKILKDYEGKTLLGHILCRLERIKKPVNIVIATSNKKQDDAVEAFCKELDVDCFRGDEMNVLKRYYDCATERHFEDVVRMTGDNPFPDIEELDRLIMLHQKNRLEYSENISVLPIGVGMEIISYRALRESLEKASLPKHYEHVNEYILDNLTHYRHDTLQVSAAKNKPDVRLTVDTLQDYEKVCFILRNAHTEYISTEQAIAISHAYEQQYNFRK